jgi:hypothetical protein
MRSRQCALRAYHRVASQPALRKVFIGVALPQCLQEFARTQELSAVVRVQPGEPLRYISDGYTKNLMQLQSRLKPRRARAPQHERVFIGALLIGLRSR